MVKLSELLSLACIGTGSNKDSSQFENAANPSRTAPTLNTFAGQKGVVPTAARAPSDARESLDVDPSEHRGHKSVSLDYIRPQHSFAAPQCDLAMFAGDKAVISSRQQTPAIQSSSGHSMQQRERADRSSGSSVQASVTPTSQQAAAVTDGPESRTQHSEASGSDDCFYHECSRLGSPPDDSSFLGTTIPGGHHPGSWVAPQQQPSRGQQQRSLAIVEHSTRSTSSRALCAREGSAGDSTGLREARNPAASVQPPQLDSSNAAHGGEASRAHTFVWMLQAEEEAAGTVFTVDISSDSSDDAANGVSEAAKSTPAHASARSCACTSMPLPQSPSRCSPAGGPRQQPQNFSSLPTLALMLLSSASSTSRSGVLSALRGGCSSSHSSRHGSTAPLLETIPSGEAVLLTTGDEEQWEALHAASAASQFGLFSGSESPCTPLTPITSPRPANTAAAISSFHLIPSGASLPSTSGGAGSAMPPRARCRSASASGWSARSHRRATAVGAVPAARGDSSGGGSSQGLRTNNSCPVPRAAEEEADGSMPLLLL